MQEKASPNLSDDVKSLFGGDFTIEMSLTAKNTWEEQYQFSPESIRYRNLNGQQGPLPFLTLEEHLQDSFSCRPYQESEIIKPVMILNPAATPPLSDSDDDTELISWLQL